MGVPLHRGGQELLDTDGRLLEIGHSHVRAVLVIYLWSGALGFSAVALAISQPIRVDKRTVAGSRVPLTTFAAAVAVAVSLMFVTVLLAAGAGPRARVQ